MSKAIALLWLGTQASQQAHEADLDAYAHAHLVRLEAPAPDAAGRAQASSAGSERVMTQIEELLEQARIASASLDATTASTRGAEVEELLRSHPELPQAAWLMAERLHIAATLRASVAPAEAEALERRAAALEGPRAPAYGSARSTARVADPTIRITLTGLRASDRLYWDGRRIEPRLEAVSGEHHVRVIRRGRVVFADWVTLDAKKNELRLKVPRAAACSRDDLEGTKITADRPEPPPDVRCARWVLARPAAQGGVEVASCRGSRCGSLFVWRKRMGSIYDGPPQPRSEPEGLPTWATVALIGAGAAVVTGVVLWQTGVFDEKERGRTRFTFDGPR